MQPKPLPQVLEQLASHQDLSDAQMHECFLNMMQGNLSDIAMAAFLTALKVKGESAQELNCAVQLLKKQAIPFQVESTQSNLLMDCCGTGGDGLNTYNVSTLCSIVLAELEIPMAKHGNGKVSSHCGSADLLGKLDIKLDLSPKQSLECLKQTNFCFLLAPQYHPATQIIQPVRKALQTKTLFNLMGPLLNPAPLTHQLVGVYCPTKMQPMIEVLRQQGIKAMVVHGDGLDELTVHGENTLMMLKEDTIDLIKLTPEEVGLKRYPLSQLVSPSPEASYQESLNLLQGRGSNALKAVVALNSAACLFLTDKVPSIKAGVELVMALLSTSKPFERLMLIKEAQRC